MTLLAIYTAANDAEFQNRCKVATWVAAQNIAAEDPATDNHGMRFDWAMRVLQEKVGITGRQLAMQVLRSADIAADPTGCSDDAIQQQTNSVIDAIIAIG